jgi:hypothetical protein
MIIYEETVYFQLATPFLFPDGGSLDEFLGGGFEKDMFEGFYQRKGEKKRK